MEFKEFAVATLPAVLAIAIEGLNPLHERYFRNQAERITDREIGKPAAGQAASVHQFQTFRTVLQAAMSGAAALSGLAPTVVAFVTACVAITFYLKEPFLWLVGLIGLGVILAVWMLRIVSARSPFSLATERLVIRGRPTRTPAALFSLLIYVTNGVVIAGFFAIWRGWFR
jgi:hypothetical protein